MGKFGIFIWHRVYEIIIMALYMLGAVIINLAVLFLISWTSVPFYTFLARLGENGNLLPWTLYTAFLGHVGRKSNEVTTLSSMVLIFLMINVIGFHHLRPDFFIFLFFVIALWPALLARFIPHILHLHGRFKPQHANVAATFD